MKILITGGAGFIASHIADHLIKKGHSVVVVDNLSEGKKENINPKAIFYQADICDASIEDIFKKEKPKAVFHFAAQINLRKSIENPVQDANTNIVGSVNVLEQCRKYGIKKIIFASTGGAMYGQALKLPTPETYLANPTSPYAVSKRAVEYYLSYYEQVFGINYVALRLANVYGPRQNPAGEAGVVAIFHNTLRQDKNPTVYGNGRQTRDFVHVDDVVDAAILALGANVSGIFNIGTGKETSVNTVFEMIKKSLGSASKKTHAPAKKGEIQRSCLSFSKVKRELGWKPKYFIEEGIKHI